VCVGPGVGGGETRVRAQRAAAPAAAARAGRPVPPGMTAAPLQLHHRQAIH
jgi:hypothetical protein